MPTSTPENFALKQFHEFSRLANYSPKSRQCGDNRIPINGNVYFQHGDLRVELPTITIIVEVESSGGVTNLAKYWECYESNRINKPMKLIHLFRQKSSNDYESHMVVWRMLCKKMQIALPNKFEGHLMPYKDGSQESLGPALELFNRWLSP